MKTNCAGVLAIIGLLAIGLTFLLLRESNPRVGKPISLPPETETNCCTPRMTRITCVNNLKQIGLTFLEWALDNEGRFPGNVSTNAGGAMEFCAVGADGFDRNAARHFQVMSNVLTSPKILVCPQDKTRRPATDIANLHAGNVTYQLRSGTNVSMENPQEVMLVCPVDGNLLYCDGAVKEMKK